MVWEGRKEGNRDKSEIDREEKDGKRKTGSERKKRKNSEIQKDIRVFIFNNLYFL